MTSANEKVTRVHGDPDSMVCLCGNHGLPDRFVPCNRLGQEIEAIEGIWDGYRYVCLDCRLIVNQHTLEVIGKKEA